MPPRIVRKWRPPLLLVLGGALAGVLASGVAGLLAMPLLAPVLGRQPAAIVALAGVVLATAILAFLLWRLILRPVTALAERARRLRDGTTDPIAPLPHYGTPELRDLGESVLEMAAALRDRATTVRAFTDHATHELKAPLSAVRGSAELLDDSQLPDADRALVAAIRTAAGRMEALLAALRAVAAAREPVQPGTTDLAAVLPRIGARPGLTLSAEGAGIRLPVPTEVLATVIGHLAANAAEHGATRLVLRAGGAGGDATLDIGDDGPGIAEGNRARIFEPFFTTRRAENGTGMGLAIAASLLGVHGARIALTENGPGAWFRIEF